LSKPDGQEDYVAFTRRLLDDMAAGKRQSADFYARLFPGAAEQIRAEVPPPSTKSTVRSGARRSFVELRDFDLGASEEALPLPDKIGKYPITGELPAGGMGRLFLARDPELDELLVIKTTKPGLAASDKNTLDRLRREATILGRLDHDRICPVTDVLLEGDRIFVVMPFIQGETLEAILGLAAARVRQGMPATEAWKSIGAAPTAPDQTPTDVLAGLQAVLGLMEEVARAIHTAHDKGVVHRDLKPGNVMVRPDGHPVVLDFGLAVDLSDAQAPRLTVRGDVIGTPSYMAPEQIRSEVDAIDRRTDVYALGVILYELLTFRRAFKGEDFHAIQTLVLDGLIDPPRMINPSVPRDVEAVCLKAIEMRQDKRYASARDFAEDLRRARLLEPTVARPSSRVARIVRIFRKALRNRPPPNP
jgi:serine/threonine protein kinase